MPDQPMPTWVLHARKFIATDKPEHLAAAQSAAPDPAISQFLTDLQQSNGRLPPDRYQPLADHLHSTHRPSESAAVQLLALRLPALFAAQPERLTPEQRQLTSAACNRAASISHQSAFPECEAVFSGTLGTLAAKLHQWNDAQPLLSHAAVLYRQLAQSEPHIYRPNVAMTLNNLANVLRNQRDFPAARRAFEEAATIYRQLAQSEPHIYRPSVAATLNNLGNVLSNQRDFPAGRRAFEEALDICRQLAESDPHIYRPNVAATLNNLGNVLSEQRDFPAARRAFEEAVGIYRQLALSEPRVYRPDVAGTLSNLGTVLCEQRDFPATRRAFEEALGIYRQLAESDPHIYRPGVAGTLNNLGNVLRAQLDLPAARQAFEEALDIRRQLAESDPQIYRPDLAGTLYSLGVVLSYQRDFSAARRASEEAAAIYRQLAHSEPHIYRPAVATMLIGLGNVLRDQRDFPAARQALEEAATIYRQLAQSEPHIYRPYVATALNNLGFVLEDLPDPAAALNASRQAVHEAENCGADPSHLWLVKGLASAAYHRLLAHLADQTDHDPTFRCLAALREGHVRALADSPKESLASAQQALQDLAPRLPRSPHILIAQSLTNSRLLLALLDDTGLHCHRADDFAPITQQIFDEIATVFDKTDRRPAPARRAAIESLASAAFAALPEPVQTALHPDSPHDLLISADPGLTLFPWESLKYATAPDAFLGLHRHLARFSPLTAPALATLAPAPFGNSQLTAAILCPHNADPDSPLRFAESEARQLAAELQSLGYSVQSHIGPAATPDALNSLLQSPPSILHYTGHGDIVQDKKNLIQNEEALVLHSGDENHPTTFYSRRDLQLLKQQRQIENPKSKIQNLLPNHPLITLNSCFTGRTRDFGGQREDLAFTLLTEGAQAVIASALPVFDPIGQIFGTSLYAPCFQSPLGMATTLLHIRRFIERILRELNSPFWPTWSLLTYHGNPYALLPHVTDSPPSASGQEQLSTHLAAILNLCTPAEADQLISHARAIPNDLSAPPNNK